MSRCAREIIASVALHVRKLFPLPGDEDQLFRVLHGQHFEHYCVDQAEYRHVGADAQREGNHGDGGESWVPAQHADRVTQILPKRSDPPDGVHVTDRKSTRLNSSHITISYAVFCLKKKKKKKKNKKKNTKKKIKLIKNKTKLN